MNLIFIPSKTTGFLQPVDQLGFETGLNEVEKKDNELIVLISKQWSKYRKD